MVELGVWVIVLILLGIYGRLNDISVSARKQSGRPEE